MRDDFPYIDDSEQYEHGDVALYRIVLRGHLLMLENPGVTISLDVVLPLFLVFLLIYLITLTGNLLILLLIFTDSHLHTPMYFFLGTLACLDMGYSSVTVPRMLFDLLTGRRVISVPACITQIYFFLFFAVSEMSVLAVMSYDRFVAICRPLHYMQIMSWNVCVQFVLGVLIFGAVHSLVHTLNLTKLTFCRADALQSFFCDLPQLLQVSCSDTFINVLLIFVFGTSFGVAILLSEEPGTQNLIKKVFT
eukprot:XP_017952723.1 PREDICTED: olfactory receptor 5B12-like [Xenopus tropicalis]